MIERPRSTSMLVDIVRFYRALPWYKRWWYKSNYERAIWVARQIERGTR